MSNAMLCFLHSGYQSQFNYLYRAIIYTSHSPKPNLDVAVVKCHIVCEVLAKLQTLVNAFCISANAMLQYCLSYIPKGGFHSSAYFLFSAPTSPSPLILEYTIKLSASPQLHSKCPEQISQFLILVKRIEHYQCGLIIEITHKIDSIYSGIC